MSTKNKILIYTNETCVYCKQVKETLSKNNITYENRLTSEFVDEYQKVSSLTGIGTVPTIKCGNDYYVAGRDFQNPEQLVHILQKFEESAFSESRRALERVKTLNYQMNMAFGRLDQLLRQIETKLNIKDEHKSTD
tara:strand:- start:123 stop:530 length:408 start_codon:yes stop_codon:yes gene_type:complete